MGLIHQTHVFSRLIEQRGQDAALLRETKNEFHEPDGLKQIGELRGLFHEANGYMGVNIVDSGKIYAVKHPMLLIPYLEDVKTQDIVSIAGRQFQITGIDDLGNLRLFLDVSLEVV